jgi:cyclohexanecarboxylate-CoA ligase
VPDARALCHVGFTSGTTGEPKGVMNTSQTLTAVLRNFVAHVGRGSFGPSTVNLVASPVGHHTGFLWGVLLGGYLDATNVYLDRWDPAHAAAVIEEFGVTTMFGAPTFVQDLLHTGLAGHKGPLRFAVVAGAPVPRSLPRDASEALGAFVCPAWGMTEWGIGIACAPSQPREALLTDGLPVANCEVRVVDDHGKPAAAGIEGRLQIRGPGLFLGYLGRPDATREAVDADGWFDTGDTALFLPSGYLELRGRSKDIVIRGGENVPVVEVESLLFAHPDVQDVAVIGVPDLRLGERACAVVVPAPGAQVDLAGLCQYLLDSGMSKHFLPERLSVVDALPKTASGKIRKVELRSRYRQVSG